IRYVYKCGNLGKRFPLNELSVCGFQLSPPMFFVTENEKNDNG
ncbi:uncharacterized protein METZ01_LOCUS158030, partial [marine metagenome]